MSAAATGPGAGQGLDAPRPFRSLRTRLALWYGGILAVCLVTYSSAVGVFFTRHVEAELDRRVHEDIELAARALVLDASGKPAWHGNSLPKAVDEEPGGGHWQELWSLEGERLLAAGTLEGMTLGRAPRAADPPHAPRTWLVPTGTVRVLTEAIEIGGRRFLLRAAVSEMAARSQVRTLWAELAALCLGVLAAGGLGSHLLSRRALAPLVRMAERARRITAEQLHERLPAEGSSELELLAGAFNATLARLERSFEQLRRFTADASHELRTPLTALRSVGEVGLRGSRDAGAYREVIGSMLEEADRLTRLVDALLTLARADAGESKLHVEPVDLFALAQEVAGHMSVLAEERDQVLEVNAEAKASVRGDRIVLRQALVNLVDNAIKYAPERTRVRLTAGRGDGVAFLEVADEGPGIPPADRERIFDRFYRPDKSRSRERGVGLGLALVKWAAEAHGGRVVLETREAGGSAFRMVLPTA